MKKILILLILMSLTTLGKEIKKDDTLTLIVDYSKSMKGKNFESAKKSSIIMIEVLELWNKMFKGKVEGLKFQYILFGGNKEITILHQLETIKDFTLLKKRIEESNPQYNTTSYSTGINEAISKLKRGDNNRTIFITDGKDEDKIVSNKEFELLGDTKFILFGKNRVNNNWLNRIKNSSEYNLENENSATSLFIMTLFEYFEDINKYLVKRGSKTVSESFELEKNSNNNDMELILIHRDYKSEVLNIMDNNGNIVNKTKYNIYNKEKFIYINLNSGLAAGKYKINFRNNNKKNMEYISFEKLNIMLKMKNPSSDKKIINGESINYEFIYYDVDNNKQIIDKDFIENTVYKIQINSYLDIIGKGIEGLNFSKSTKESKLSYGKNKVLSGWNYNTRKATEKDNAGEIEVVKDGVLVNIEYDMNQLWEGRDLKIVAKITEDAAAKDIDEIKLNIGNSKTVLLKKVALNLYIGIVENIKSGNYKMEIESVTSKTNKEYLMGIKSKSKTIFQVENRKIYVEMDIPKDGYFEDEKSSFLKKINYLLKKTEKEQINFEIDKSIKNKEISYNLPYSKQFKDKMEIKIWCNKIFEDEKLDINIQSVPNKKAYYVYSNNQIVISEKKKDKCIMLEFGDIKKVKLEKENDKIKQYLKVEKEAGKINIENNIIPEPLLRINGELRTKTGNKILFNSNIIFNIKTSKIDFIQTAIVEGFIKTVIGIGIVIAILLIILIILIKIMIFKRKVKKWKNLQDESIEDYFEKLPLKLKNEIGNIDTIEVQNKTKEIDNITLAKRKCKKYVIETKPEKVAKLLKLKEIKEIENMIDKEYRYDWKLYYDNMSLTEIKITRDEKDLDIKKEDTIRVKYRDAKYYGKIEIYKDKVFITPSGISIFKQKDRSYNLISTKTEIEKIDKLYFGNSETNIKFILNIEVTVEYIVINIVKM